MLHLDWLGAFFLGICGLPAAIKALRSKKADDISWLFLIFWMLGEILLLIDRYPKQDWALVANYFANILFIAIILKYKICPSTKACITTKAQEK